MALATKMARPWTLAVQEDHDYLKERNIKMYLSIKPSTALVQEQSSPEEVCKTHGSRRMTRHSGSLPAYWLRILMQRLLECSPLLNRKHHQRNTQLN